MDNSSYTNMPGIEVKFDTINPTIKSPNSVFELPFEQDENTLMDAESYKDFISGTVSNFRKTRTYTHYKAFLYDLGLNHCQIHGNITSDMATIEMHHNMLTVFDIAFIITEHTIKTRGHIDSFDLIHLLKQVHTQHKVQLVMLSKTPHQIYHDNPEAFIPIEMCIGDWISFLNEYHYGITQDIAFKILYYLDKDIQLDGKTNYDDYIKLRNTIMDWSIYNEYN